MVSLKLTQGDIVKVIELDKDDKSTNIEIGQYVIVTKSSDDSKVVNVFFEELHSDSYDNIEGTSYVMFTSQLEYVANVFDLIYDTFGVDKKGRESNG